MRDKTWLRRSARPDRVGDGVIAAGRLDQAGQQSGLGHTHFGGVFPEVLLGRRLHPVGAVAQVDEVQICVEDLCLCVLLLQALGQDRFSHLAVERLLVGQKGLGQLLGDGRAALDGITGVHVGPQRPYYRLHVHAPVHPEAVVLGVQHGLHQYG